MRCMGAAPAAHLGMLVVALDLRVRLEQQLAAREGAVRGQVAKFWDVHEFELQHILAHLPVHAHLQQAWLSRTP